MNGILKFSERNPGYYVKVRTVLSNGTRMFFITLADGVKNITQSFTPQQLEQEFYSGREVSWKGFETFEFDEVKLLRYLEKMAYELDRLEKEGRK